MLCRKMVIICVFVLMPLVVHSELLISEGRLVGASGITIGDVEYEVLFEHGSYDEVFGMNAPTFIGDGAAAIDATSQIFAMITANGTYPDRPQDIGGCSSFEFCGIAVPFDGPFSTPFPSTPFSVDVQTAFFESGPADGQFSQPLATNLTFEGQITYAVFRPSAPPTPAELLAQLRDAVVDIGPPGRLEFMIESAERLLELPNRRPVCRLMRFFDAYVRAYNRYGNVYTWWPESWKISDTQRDILLEQSAEIQLALDCD